MSGCGDFGVRVGAAAASQRNQDQRRETVAHANGGHQVTTIVVAIRRVYGSGVADFAFGRQNYPLSTRQ
jgi:hypothetical protein